MSLLDTDDDTLRDRMERSPELMVLEVRRLQSEMQQLQAAPSPLDAVHLGATLYGYCGGMFGRDSYGEKVVEGLGHDWCVAREDNGEVSFAWSPGRDVRESLVEFTVKPADEW